MPGDDRVRALARYDPVQQGTPTHAPVLRQDAMTPSAYAGGIMGTERAHYPAPHTQTHVLKSIQISFIMYPYEGYQTAHNNRWYRYAILLFRCRLRDPGWEFG